MPTKTAPPTPTPTPLCERNGHGGTETIQVQPQRIIKGIHIDLRGRQTFGGNLYGFSLWEVEIYGPSTGNLARGKGVTAIASSEQNDMNCSQCLAIAAIDGKNSTNTPDIRQNRWSSDFHEPQWLEITLSTPQVVNRIVLKWEEAYAREYCITLIE